MIAENWPYALVLGAVLGLVAGSYLATVLVRWPNRILDVQVPRSRCDDCSRQLAWFELVPVMSFVIQRGRCRSCAARIAPVHVVIELACGAIGAMTFALGVPMLAPLAWLGMTLALFDARHLWLPDPLVAAFAICALLAPPWPDGLTLALRLAGGFAGFASLWLLANGYRRLRGRTGLGGGDAKLFGSIGLWVGPATLPAVMLGACAIGLSDAWLRVRGGADASTVRLPLGAYLIIATSILIAVKLITRW